jgi:hypothetical protein
VTRPCARRGISSRPFRLTVFGTDIVLKIFLRDRSETR